MNSLFENFTEESEELGDNISSDNEGSDYEFFGSFIDFDECNIRFYTEYLKIMMKLVVLTPIFMKMK